MTTTTTLSPLDRAHRDGLRVRRHQKIDGLTLVSSSRDPHVWYRVTHNSCTCPDHQRRGRICKHMAIAAEFRAKEHAAPATITPISAAPSYRLHRWDRTAA